MGVVATGTAAPGVCAIDFRLGLSVILGTQPMIYLLGLCATRRIRPVPNPEGRGAGDGMKEPSPTCSKTNWFSGFCVN